MAYSRALNELHAKTGSTTVLAAAQKPPPRAVSTPRPQAKTRHPTRPTPPHQTYPLQTSTHTNTEIRKEPQEETETQHKTDHQTKPTKEHTMTAYIITHDHNNTDTEGTTGPGHITASDTNRLTAGEGIRFRLLDDDHEILYYGYRLEASNADTTHQGEPALVPLHTFATHTGCVRQQEKAPDGSWQTHADQGQGAGLGSRSPETGRSEGRPCNTW